MAHNVNDHHGQPQEDVDKGVHPPEEVSVARANWSAALVQVTVTRLVDFREAFYSVPLRPLDTLGETGLVSCAPGKCFGLRVVVCRER